jgi:hypothetical protein
MLRADGLGLVESPNQPIMYNVCRNCRLPLTGPPGFHMHGLGRRHANALLSTLLLAPLLLAVVTGCNQNSAGQFHTYQPASKPAEGEPAAVDTKPADAPSNVSPATTRSPKPVEVERKTARPETARPDATPGTPSTPVAKTPPAESAVVVTSAKSPGVPLASISASSPATAAKGPQKAGSAAPRTVQLLVPNKTFRTEGEALRVSYDDIDLLKVLNMEPVPPDAANFMPGWLKALDGRRIRIRGFMYPTFQQTGIHAFGLARDNQICCFGRNPKIYDVFDVVLHEGTTTNYIPNRPFDVVGVFHIRPEAEDGKLYRLYEMEDATVMAK